MMPRAAISEAQARAIYSVLVTVCGAHTDDELSFVLCFTGQNPTNEWRFQGHLGFGGKFRYPGMTVDCYREDETPNRLAIIKEANQALANLNVAA